MKHRSHLRLMGCTIVALAASALLGCSVHPLPQDLSPANTVQIVSRIRCEAREGLEAVLQKAVLQGSLQQKHARKIVKYTTIGLEFQFVMTEINSAAATQLKLERETARAGESFQIIMDGGVNSAHTLPPDGNGTRQNTRTFRVVDDLEELEAARCGRRAKSAEPNLIHPVTGSTGMAEIVSTYLELEMLTDLASAKQTDPIIFKDRLTFTATLQAATAIELELRTPVAGLKLTKASLGASALRRDVHTVFVVLTREQPEIDVDKLETRRLGQTRKMERQLDRFRGVQDSDLRARLTQRSALARNRVLFELDRQRLVTEENAVAARVLGIPLP
jgi:hypothetical protein